MTQTEQMTNGNLYSEYSSTGIRNNCQTHPQVPIDITNFEAKIGGCRISLETIETQ